MIHYILKDFQSMFKTQKFLIILLICIQLLSVIVIFFAYGVTNHYNVQIGVTEGTDLFYGATTTNRENTPLTYERISQFHKVLLEQYEYKIDEYITISYDNQITSGGEKISCDLYTAVKYIDEEYTVGSARFYDVVLVNIVNDSYIYNEDEYIIEKFDKGERVALVGEEFVKGNETITINGEEFTIIGILSNHMRDIIYIPHSHMQEEGKYDGGGIILSKPLLENEYEELEEIVESCFDGKAKLGPEFNGIKNENQYRVYKSIIAILAAFVVMSGVNYSIIFSHIIEKRRRMLAVSRICGCTGIKSVFIYMIEIMSMSLVTLIGGMMIFIYVILPRVKSTFEYMEYYLNTKVYIELAAIYIGILVVMYLFLVLRLTRKTPVKLIKGV